MNGHDHAQSGCRSRIMIPMVFQKERWQSSAISSEPLVGVMRSCEIAEEYCTSRIHGSA